MENKNDVIEEVVNIEEETQNGGTVKIAPDVVATIAGVCAAEVKGVAGMCSTFAGGLAERFGGKKNITKGIKVDINDANVGIDLYIIVEFGVKITDLAWEIQESVKSNVESMTGLNVEYVNVHVDGIKFIKDEPQETEEIEIEDEEILDKIEEEPEGGSEDL